jgi:inosose dehydratase
MQKNSSLKRRNFLVSASAIAGSFGIIKRVGAQEAAPACCVNPVACCASGPDKGLKLGVASYSLRKFSLDEAIQMTLDCNVKYITLKSFHLDFPTSAAQRKEAAKKVKDAGLVMMGGGVINLKTTDENEIRAAFQYCKDAGMKTMVTSPSPQALPYMEKMVKEYDINVAIHNHGPGDNLYPSPMDAYKLVKDMDPRMGCCIDVGHTVRIGVDEVESIYAVKDRLHDFHIKDVSERTPKGQTIPVGRGVIDIPKVLKALIDIKFTEHVALEYESDADNPIPGMRESFGYIRGVLAAL